jgi:alpha-L-fucosidase 2
MKNNAGSIQQNLKRAVICGALALWAVLGAEASTPIKVACVGDSITFGHGIADRENNSYPAQLGKMLGKGWEVRNFGVSGSTLLRKGDHPYIKTPRYEAALKFEPDVVIIKLGTNDTKPQNWNQQAWKQKKAFIGDYILLINSFRNLESKPVVWICKPVPVFSERGGINDKTVRGEIIPCIQYIARKAGVPMIDLYTPLKGHPEFFPDKVHPNAAGATEMAKIIAARLSKYGKNAPAFPEPVNGPVDELVLWDDLPAYDFELAYPVGNGRLGAMPYANFPQERILLNEETIWENTQPMFMSENCFPHLEKVRELEAAGDYAGTDAYFQKHLSGAGSPRKVAHSYQLLGWLNLDYRNTAAIKSTVRSLDLKTGVARAVYTLVDGSTITQDVFACAPDDVIAVTIRSDKPLDLGVMLEGAQVEGTDLVITGQATGSEGTRFTGRVRVAHPAAVASGDALDVQQAKAITLYFSASTDFTHLEPAKKRADGWQKEALADLDALNGKSIDDVKKAAVADHQKYFNRVDSDFGRTADEIRKLPTPLRLDRIKQGAHDDPDLMETYFQFGRYLLIASSRPGCLPANLQGLWNPYKNAPWGSDYHLNINLQMNYWPAETCNLAEMHQPFIDLIRSYQPTGKEMARRLGMKGWCMGHSTDVWGSARLMGKRPLWAASFLSGQWTTFHILEQYRFNLDPKIIEDNWDVLTDSVTFADSWLIDGPDGTLMTRPSTSPENMFSYKNKDDKLVQAAISAGNTYDQFLTLQVFNDYLEAADVLGKQDDPFVKKIRARLPKVYRPRIADDGRLMEWRKPFKEARPGHRHISHVIGAYPGNQINLDDDPKMRSAVLKSIEGRLKRGGAGTGWSRAWMIGMFARFSDGERAYENLHAILTKSTLDNLWDNHPPFQIDGNFGATAAIAEMLLHSHNNEIKLLPALPAKWSDGHIKGLKARGDYTVDISWKNGELAGATIRAGAKSPESVRVVYKNKSIELRLKPGKSKSIDPKNF